MQPDMPILRNAITPPEAPAGRNAGPRPHICSAWLRVAVRPAPRRRIHAEAGSRPGREIEIVDDTEFDDLFGSAVVGNQIAAESREMGMVLQIDMHLLTRMGCEQNGQHKGCEALFEAEVHCLHGGEDTKKRDRDKRPLQKYLQMRMYVLSGTPRGKRTPPEKSRAVQMLMSRISKWIVPAGTSTSTRSPFLRPSSAFAIGVPIASLPSRRFASCSATIV